MRSGAGPEGRWLTSSIGILTGLAVLVVATSATVAISLAATGAAKVATPGSTASGSTASGSVPATALAKPVSADDRAALYRAEQLMVQKCMADKGFRYWPVPQQPSPDYRQFSYLVTDVGWAKKHGYGQDIEHRLDRESQTGPATRYFKSLSAQRHQALGDALSGPEPVGLSVANPIGGTLTHSDKGCTATVWKQLYGDAQAWFAAREITTNLRPIFHTRVVQDPEFVAGIADWRICMRPFGYADPDPRALRGRVLSTENLSPPVHGRPAWRRPSSGWITGTSSPCKPSIGPPSTRCGPCSMRPCRWHIPSWPEPPAQDQIETPTQ
jgi:hypothetical protein